MFRKMRQYMRGPLWIWPIPRIYFEVENPAQMSDKKLRRGAMARLKRFNALARSRKYLISQIDWDYRQPFPDIEVLNKSKPGDELKMHLLVASKSDCQPISAHDLCEVIKFIYTTVYASVVNERHPGDRKYLAYLDQLAIRECKRIEATGCQSFRLKLYR
jgi:hypothetical protein